MSGRRGFVAAAWAGVLLLAGAGQSLADGVEPVAAWAGIFRDKRDEKLKEEAPKDRFLTDEKAFAKLWKAWRPKEKMPKIDFKKQFVLVATTTGPNSVVLANTKVDDKGNFTATVGSTLVFGDGFGYLIAVFDRKGVKTVFGKPLGKAKE
jgi:hypothetical protein